MDIKLIVAVLILVAGVASYLGFKFGFWLADQQQWEESRVAAGTLEKAACDYAAAIFEPGPGTVPVPDEAARMLLEQEAVMQGKLLDSALAYARSQGWASPDTTIIDSAIGPVGALLADPLVQDESHIVQACVEGQWWQYRISSSAVSDRVWDAGGTGTGWGAWVCDMFDAKEMKATGQLLPREKADQPPDEKGYSFEDSEEERCPNGYLYSKEEVATGCPLCEGPCECRLGFLRVS